MRQQLDHITRQLRDVQSGKLWMGKNYASRLKRITEQEAFVQPVGHMHSVAELLSHLTAWRKDALVKIQTGAGRLTDDQKENWMPVDALKTKGWSNVLADYEKSLDDLLAILNTKDDSFLDDIYYDTDYRAEFPYRFLLEGILHHDLYHLGQLGITIKYLHELPSNQ